MTQHISVTVNGDRPRGRRRAAPPPRPPPPRRRSGSPAPTPAATRATAARARSTSTARSAKSCTILAVQADGAEITTIEGMEQGGKLHPLQQAFWDQHGLQCGFCTPGMIMQSAWLLEQNPEPTDEEVREGIAGNLCRCTGYVNIVKAVQQAAAELRAAEGAGTGTGAAAPEREETTMTLEAQEPTTTPEVAGMGHSMKRKEDPRFIRGRGEYIEDVVLPEHGLDGHRPQPVRPREDQVDRRDRGPGDAGRARRDHRQGPREGRASTGCRRSRATSRWCCRSTRSCTRPRRSRRSSPQTRYQAADAINAVYVDYEPLPVVDRPVQGARARCAGAAQGPGRGQAEQPHLALGVRRRGPRPTPRSRRRTRSSRSTSTSRASTSPRSRPAAASPTGTRSRPPRLPRHEPGAARLPHGHQPRVGHPREHRSGSRPTTSAAASAARCRSTRATSSRSSPRSRSAGRSSGSRTGARTSRPTRSRGTTTSTPSWASTTTAR